MKQQDMKPVFTVIHLLILVFIPNFLCQENNVCPTFEDYYTIKNNSNCWYDLTAQYSAPEIIKHLGYPVEEHRVQTEDGYIVTMFRIPSDRSRNPRASHYPVYLQHGLVATCANFLGLGKNSLAILLADAGFDVWLGNYRGSQYSEGHVRMSVKDEAYWDHSMDEIVHYDFPAAFNRILSNSPPNSQIIYIGHSLGTSLALMYGAAFPAEAHRIMKIFVFMSPAYTLSNMISPYKMGAPMGDRLVENMKELELTRLFSQAESLQRLVQPFCLESPKSMRFCMQLYNLFYGANAELGPEVVPVYFNQLPGGTSLKVLNHAADFVQGNFRRYNYKNLNYKYYGTHQPPVYNISNIHIPVYLIFSTQDWATSEADAWNLYRNLPEDARFGVRRVNLPKFNHIDFVFGRHARKVVYEPIIEKLNHFLDTSHP